MDRREDWKVGQWIEVVDASPSLEDKINLGDIVQITQVVEGGKNFRVNINSEKSSIAYLAFRFERTFRAMVHEASLKEKELGKGTEV